MIPVATPHIPQIWPKVLEKLLPAIERGGEHTPESVYRFLMEGSMLLWYNKSAFAVTSWCDYPAGRIAYVLFAGGEHADEWVEHAAHRFKQWATSMGCKELRIIGRKGWGRLLRIDETDVTFRAKLGVR